MTITQHNPPGQVIGGLSPAEEPGTSEPFPSPSANRVPPATPNPSATRDPYGGVVTVLLMASLLGLSGAVAAGRLLGNKVLLDAAVSLALASFMLSGVSAAQIERARRRQRASTPAPVVPADPPADVAVENIVADDASTAAQTERRAEDVATEVFGTVSPEVKRSRLQLRFDELQSRFDKWLRNLGPLGIIRIITAVTGVLATLRVLTSDTPIVASTPAILTIAAGVCLAGAALAGSATRYLAELEPGALSEAAGLTRGARVIAWILVFAALSIGFEWAGQNKLVQLIHVAVVAINLTMCYGLLAARPPADADVPAFPLDIGPLIVLGSRPNLLASLVDSAERQLGIDLRSTWALTVVRRGLEPLVIGLFLLGWLSTSLTVVGVEEQGLVERLGVPVKGDPLAAGIHVHWPWPIDQVYRLPARRVQALGVGHEGEEAPGPENVLWAVQHADKEFTLLLGNGRDLITVDAALQYRIVDPRAWRYHSQNPAAALKAFAYRAVMRNTVNRTLSEALSENVSRLTERMRSMVQQDADSLGLGVEVIGFTVGGMHPPVAVAPSYESVVSAQISKVTTVVNAQVFRNQTLPAAEGSVLVATNAARAEGAENLARAAGEAWSFRALEAQYHAAPADYLFRRRLETLEKNLIGHGFTVLDSRYLRDGGELWITP